MLPEREVTLKRKFYHNLATASRYEQIRKSFSYKSAPLRYINDAAFCPSYEGYAHPHRLVMVNIPSAGMCAMHHCFVIRATFRKHSHIRCSHGMYTLIGAPTVSLSLSGMSATVVTTEEPVLNSSQSSWTRSSCSKYTSFLCLVRCGKINSYYRWHFQYGNITVTFARTRRVVQTRDLTGNSSGMPCRYHC